MFKANWEKTSVTHQLPDGIFEQMVRLVYPDKKLISHELIAGGCANLNIKILLEDEPRPFILRIYLRDKNAAYIEKKLGILLKETVPVPVTHYIGELEGYHFAITEFMPGLSLRDLLLGNYPYDLSEIMHEVGTILSKIMSHEFPKAGFFDKELNVAQGFDEENLNHFALACLKHPQVKRYLTLEIRASLQHHLERLPDFTIKSGVLVHADFDPANILVEQQDGKWKVTAVLDWEFAYSGSWMCDVATMLRYAHKMPPEFQDAFLKGLTDNGVTLPENLQLLVHQFNIEALLDGITRHPLHLRPNIYQDILELIDHILLELNSIIL